MSYKITKPLGLVTTRIRDFKASNDRPIVGERVSFEGFLEWHDPICRWFGLDGLAVKLLLNGSEIASVNTTSGGFFRFYHSFESKGRYTVKARFEGTYMPPWYNPVESTPIEITVLTKEEKEKEEEQKMMQNIYLGLGIGAVAVIGVVGYLAYKAQVERKELWQMLMMRERG